MLVVPQHCQACVFLIFLSYAHPHVLSVVLRLQVDVSLETMKFPSAQLLVKELPNLQPLDGTKPMWLKTVKLTGLSQGLCPKTSEE